MTKKTIKSLRERCFKMDIKITRLKKKKSRLLRKLKSLLQNENDMNKYRYLFSDFKKKTSYLKEKYPHKMGTPLQKKTRTQLKKKISSRQNV